MIEETTQTSEQTNSEETNSSQTEDQSNTSTTQTQEADEKLDLSKTGEAEQTSETETEETDEEKAAREEQEALFGAPEGDAPYVLEGLPEGMSVDEEALADITPIAKQLGLSNKGLSAIASVYAEKVLPRVAQQTVTNLENSITAKRAEWEGEAKDAIAGKVELKNLAGEPLSFDKRDVKSVQAVAAKALDKLAPEGFRAFLDETGLSVHPAMVAFAYNAGKAIAEDTDVETTETGSKREATPSERRKAGGMDPGKFF